MEVLGQELTSIEYTKSMDIDTNTNTTSNMNIGATSVGLNLPEAETMSIPSSVSVSFNNHNPYTVFYTQNPVVPKSKGVKRPLEHSPENTIMESFNKVSRVHMGVTEYSNGAVQGQVPPTKMLTWNDYIEYIDTNN